MSYLTQEEIKEHISHHGEYFKFSSCVDLSQGVLVQPLYHDLKDIMVKPERLIMDTALFTSWWINNFHKRLNGFSGLDTIKYTLKR